MSKAKEIKEAAHKEIQIEKEPVLSRRNLLSTGSTLLNLSFSGKYYGGLLAGKYYWLVGDSTSGKTFLSMTCFAEAHANKYFKDYRLIYDNVEDGNLIDIKAMFNAEVAAKVEPPAYHKKGDLKDTPKHSFCIEDFYYNIDDALNAGKPFIYVLDSMDGLSSEAELGKFKQHKEAYEKGKDAPGSYGDGKAKKNSEGMRKIIRGLRDTNSILIVISQTRDNLGYGAKKISSGGRALKFYATVEFWTSVASQLTKTIKGKERKIGVQVKCDGKKNRIIGKLYEVEIPIYPSYGIDDLGSCVDYLLAEKWWTKAKGAQTFKAPEFGLECSQEKLIQTIEEQGKEDDLRRLVAQCWAEIEEACSLKRKNRYEMGAD